MNDPQLLNEVADDVRDSQAGCVIYLEGKTDVEIFFALLGHYRPSGDLHQGVLIRGLQAGAGSGSEGVRRRVQLGAGLGGGTRVYGILDGDGRSLSELTARFDSPFAGPLFSWKAYCIENLLAKAGWPPAWGREPEWQRELGKYSPYVGLNRLHQRFSEILERLQIARFTSPAAGQPLLKADEVSRNLEERKEDIIGLDIQQDFRAEVANFDRALHTDLAEAHCLLNGKWLISHHAVSVVRQSADSCRSDWVTRTVEVGGLPEVKDWWRRVIGKAP